MPETVVGTEESLAGGRMDANNPTFWVLVYVIGAVLVLFVFHMGFKGHVAS